MRKRITRLTTEGLTARAFEVSKPTQAEALRKLLERGWAITRVTVLEGKAAIGVCLQGKAAWLTDEGGMIAALAGRKTVRINLRTHQRA